MPKINIVRPDGSTFSGTTKELERLQLIGNYRAETTPELADRLGEDANKSYAEENTGESFLRGLASGATLGATDLINPLSEADAYADTENSGYRLSGELLGGIAGSIAGVGPAGSLSKVATSAGNLAGGGLKTAAVIGAVEGAGAGVQQAISEAAVSNDPLSASHIIAGAGWNSLFGMGLGAGINLLGRGLSAAGKAIKPEVLPPPLKKVTEEVTIPGVHLQGGTEYYDELVTTSEPAVKKTNLTADMESESIEKVTSDVVDDISPVGEEEFNKLKSSIDEFVKTVPEPTGFTPKVQHPDVNPFPKTPDEFEKTLSIFDAQKDELLSAFRNSKYDPDVDSLETGSFVQDMKHQSMLLNSVLKDVKTGNSYPTNVNKSLSAYNTKLEQYAEALNPYLIEKGLPPVPTLKEKGVASLKNSQQFWSDSEKEMVKAFGQMNDEDTIEAIQHWRGVNGNLSYTGMQSEARYYDNGKWANHAERLQEAIESGRLPNNMKLYRGINNYPVKNLEIGSTISTHGFTATSMSESQAKVFAEQSIAGLLNNKSGKTGLVLEMNVKKGTPALYVQDAEKEILFGRRTKLVLESTPIKGPDGLFHAKAKLIPGVSSKYTANKISEVETIFNDVDEMAGKIYDDVYQYNPERIAELDKMKAAGEKASKALRRGKFKAAKEGLDEYIAAIKAVEHLSDIKTGIPQEAAKVFVSAAAKKLLKNFPKSRSALQNMSEGKLEEMFGSLDAVMQDVTNPLRYFVESEINNLVDKSGLVVEGTPVQKLKKIFEINRASKTDKLITTIEEFIHKPVVEKVDLEAEEQLADEFVTKKFRREKKVDKEVYFKGKRERLVPSGKEVRYEDNKFSVGNKLMAHAAGAIAGSAAGWGLPGLATYYAVKNYLYGGPVRINALKNAVRKNIGRAADLTGKKLRKPEVAKLSAVIAPLYTRLDGTPASEKSKEDAALARINEISEAAPSVNDVLYKAVEPLIGTDPDLALSLHTQAVKAFNSFYNMMPKDPGVSFSGMKSLWKPNDLQIIQFAKLKHVFDSPLEVIAEFMEGNVDNYKVMALRNIHTEMWEDLRNQVMSTLDFTKLNYNEQSRMSQLLDIDIHSSFSPQGVAEAQRIFMEAPESSVKKPTGRNSQSGREPPTLGQTNSA